MRWDWPAIRHISAMAWAAAPAGEGLRQCGLGSRRRLRIAVGLRLVALWVGVGRIARVFVVVFGVGHGVLQGERFASGRV